jgi:phage tail tube protein FII
MISLFREIEIVNSIYRSDTVDLMGGIRNKS